MCCKKSWKLMPQLAPYKKYDQTTVHFFQKYTFRPRSTCKFKYLSDPHQRSMQSYTYQISMPGESWSWFSLFLPLKFCWDVRESEEVQTVELNWKKYWLDVWQSCSIRKSSSYKYQRDKGCPEKSIFFNEGVLCVNRVFCSSTSSVPNPVSIYMTLL